MSAQDDRFVARAIAYRAAQQAQARLQAAQAQADEPTESDRAHLFTGAAGVLLPAAQALVTGALAGLAAGFYAWLLKSPQAWKWGAGVAAGVVVLAWLAMLWRWLNLTRPLERLTGWDLNRDGIVGDPPQAPQVVRVELRREDGRQLQFAELPTSREKLADFARGVLAGQAISEARWSGAGALFSKNEFRALRDELINRGWLRWKNPDYHDQGVDLAPAGRAVLARLAEDDTE